MLYTRVIYEALRTPWALMPEMLAVVADVLRFRAMGGRLTADEIRARIGSDESRPRPEARTLRADRGRKGGAIGIVPVYGVIAHRTFEASSGMSSAEMIGARLQQFVDDPDIGTIVLDVSSPGGSVAGVPELADRIYQARKAKRIVGIANALAASAGYWLLSQADEVVVTPSGSVGSIGVYALHEDWSAWLEKEGVRITAIQAGNRKLEGAPWQPLNEEAKAHFQASVDEAYQKFTQAVARGRGVPVAEVRGERFGEGRVFSAKDALERGMVDRLESFDAMIDRLLQESAGASGRAGARAEADPIEPRADVEVSIEDIEAQVQYMEMVVAAGGQP